MRYGGEDLLAKQKSQRVIGPFSIFKRKPLVKLQKLCLMKQKDIRAQTKELFNFSSVNLDNRENEMSLIEDNSSNDDDKEIKSMTKVNSMELMRMKRTGGLKKLSGSVTQRNKSEKGNCHRQLLDDSNINNEFQSMGTSHKSSTVSRTSSLFMMKKLNKNSHPLNRTNRTQLSIQDNQTERIRQSHTGGHLKSKVNCSLNWSNPLLNKTQRYIDSPMKSTYKFISSTLEKSIRVSERFKRNMSCYLEEQNKMKGPSLPKKEKSKKELELEGKYEELTEKMKYHSKSYKGYLASFKNQRTGKYQLIKQGNANLMTFIDNFFKMEDCLFLEYKGMVRKEYQAIQEAADIMRKENEEDNKVTSKENELDAFIKKVKELSYNLKLKSSLLKKRLNRDILMNGK